MLPTYLAATAVIGLGAILLFQGATVVLHYGELLDEAGWGKQGWHCGR